MNAIGFVFSILAILSFGFFVSLEKQTGAQRLRSSYMGHLYANREIKNRCESAFYKSLQSRPTEKKEEHSEKREVTHKPYTPPLINPACARLNLFPLIEQGVQTERCLYLTAIKLLHAFYGKTLPKEEQFLNAWLEAIRTQLATENLCPLEKVKFKDPSLQLLYYRLLKGTKNGAIYPSLLDYFKVEKGQSKLCISHARPNLLEAIFSSKAGHALHEMLHASRAPALSRETIERVCMEAFVLTDPALFDLLELERPLHPQNPNELVMGIDSETEVFLKKRVAMLSEEKE